MLIIRTLAQYRELRAKVDAFDAASRTKYGTPRRWATRPDNDPSLPVEPSAQERGAVEQWEWDKGAPERYFAYVDEGNALLITWSGHILGRITLGRLYKSNMGDTRRPIKVLANNGMRYAGTYYCGNGTYARIKRLKA